jgi:DNA polymerase III delta prime subunit
MLNIHQSIKEKLDYFHKIHKIPNIIFHGPYGSGKKTLVNEFISKIYDDNRDKMKTFVMYVNCAHGKGIKFIREELKFFAKTQINTNGGDVFKSIVLINADKLTMDAQSALRRCIELFNHNTRFFIIVEDKYKLLKPILSRFCEIYVAEPVIQGLPINLYKYNVIQAFKKQRETKKDSEMKKDPEMKTKVKKETAIKISSKDFLQEDNKKNSELIKEMSKINECLNKTDSSNTNIDKSNKLIAISTKLYESGYSGLDIIELLENEKYEVLILVQQTNNNININNYNEFLLGFNKVRKEFRNEKLLMFFILNFLFLSLDTPLENISIM